MRKVYENPELTVEKMNISLLVQVSDIRVSDKTGTFDAKDASGSFDEEFDDE